MGCGSWANLAKLAGVEVVFAGVEAYMDSKDKDNSITIEQCISQGVFGSGEKENVFDTIKAQAGWLDAERCEGVTRINSNLKRPVGTFSLGGFISRGAKAFASPIITAVGNVKKSFEEAAQNAAQAPQNQEAPSANNTTPTRTAEAQLAARSGNPQTEQQMEQNPQVSDATDDDDNIRQEPGSQPSRMEFAYGRPRFQRSRGHRP